MTNEKAMAIAKLMVEYVSKRKEYDDEDDAARRMILEDEYLSVLERVERMVEDELC